MAAWTPFALVIERENCCRPSITLLLFLLFYGSRRKSTQLYSWHLLITRDFFSHIHSCFSKLFCRCLPVTAPFAVHRFVQFQTVIEDLNRGVHSSLVLNTRMLHDVVKWKLCITPGFNTTCYRNTKAFLVLQTNN